MLSARGVSSQVWGLLRWVIVGCLALFTAAGCSGDASAAESDTQMPPVDELAFGVPVDDGQRPGPVATLSDEIPEVIIEDVANQIVADSGVEPMLDGLGEAEPERVLVLDDAALDACGHVEEILSIVDSNSDEALQRLFAAIKLTEQSTLEDIAVWSEHLDNAVLEGADEDLAPLVGFVSVCVNGGYSL